MTAAGVVASKIYSVKDIMEDETYKARGNIVTVDDRNLGRVRMQNVVRKWQAMAESLALRTAIWRGQ